MANRLRDGDPTQVGPYQLHGRLPGGGMGQVFLGRSPGGMMVAVKVVRSELADDAGFRRRFATEVEAARRVGGFYTAQVVDADPDGDPPWLATSYIPGPSLHQAVDDHGALPTESVAVLGAGLAEGLATVHAKKLVHRDLKPANVILAADGPRLIDFGIARALDTTSYTQTHTVLGTAAFMSPEQALAEHVEAPSDVFSLGCVLAFAATGDSPFGAGPSHAVIYRVIHEDPDLTGLPALLVDLVAACLTKDPDARPDPDQVLDELTAQAPTLGDRTEGRWLPEALTEIVVERQTLKLTTTDADRDEPPKRTLRQPDRGQADLQILNVGPGKLDAVCDGAVLGTIHAGDIGTFPIAPGTRALKVRSATHSRALRSVDVRPNATLRFAFDFRKDGHIPQPVDTVTFLQRKRWIATRVLNVVALLVLSPPLLFSPIVLLYALGFSEIISGIGGGAVMVFLGWALSQFLESGPAALEPRAAGRLSLGDAGIEFTLANHKLKWSIRWSDLDQVSVVGDGDDAARLVVWPHEGRPRPKGEEFQGGIAVCKPGDVSAMGKRDLQRLRAALRWFAGDVYVEQSI